MARGQRTGGRGGYGRREVRVLKRWEAGEMGGKYISQSRREPGMQATGVGRSGTAVPSPTYVGLLEGLTC